LGLSIIGTHDSVGSFGREDLVGYVGRRYSRGNTLVCASGKLDVEAFRDAAEGALSSLGGEETVRAENPPLDHAGEFLQEHGSEQVHFCIGGGGITKSDPRRHAAWVFDALMGGSMSSRLHMEIREKRGLVYSVGSYLASYADGGTWVIYGGTSPAKFKEVRSVVDSELAKIRETLVGDEELVRAKRMLKGSIVMGLEATSTRMRRLAANEIVFGRQVPIEEVVAEIDKVTPEDVRSVARDLADEASINTTALGKFG
jgi:predicted Zn-dependent peptidase